MPIQFKASPYLLAFAAFLVLVTMALVWHHDVSWKEGAAFVVGALAMPGLFGAKPGPDDPPPPPPPPPAPATIILSGALLTLALAGCFPADKKVEAAAGYSAQQTKCVEQYATKSEIDACRDRVKAAWAVTDAGQDGGP